jgi:hypothetical protein
MHHLTRSSSQLETVFQHFVHTKRILFLCTIFSSSIHQHLNTYWHIEASMANRSCLVLLLAASAVLTIIDGQDLQDRCGDCWCIAGTDGTCPTDTTGISDPIPENYEAYLTFVLSNPDADFLTLQTADGISPCYPFADTLGAPIDGYPLSNEPQCNIPISTDTTVCAYVYDPASTSCEGRSYEIMTYSDEAEAAASGAVVIHQGG